MKAIILAAGQGTRLKKYTQDLPKGMLVFQGKTLIERQIDLYRKCGINEIIVVRGYAADKIKYEGVRYYNNDEFSTTNMVESLLTARTEFTDNTIVSYSDVLFDELMLRAMIDTKGDISVAVDDNWKKYWLKRYGRIDFDTESLIIDDQNHIISIGLGNPSVDKIDARYIGLLKFSKNALTRILDLWNRDYDEYQKKPWQQSGKCIRQAYMTDLLNAIIQNGHPVEAIRFNNGWIEFDTNDDYERASQWTTDGSINQLLRM